MKTTAAITWNVTISTSQSWNSLQAEEYQRVVKATGSQVPAWYDEYEAQLGAPAEAAPAAAAQNGIWMRRFENGVVLVNPSRTASASIDVGAGYRRLSGTQDPAVNSGAVESVVTPERNAFEKPPMMAPTMPSPPDVKATE